MSWERELLALGLWNPWPAGQVAEVPLAAQVDWTRGGHFALANLDATSRDKKEKLEWKRRAWD